MRCDACGTELASSEGFCPQCGEPRPGLPPPFALAAEQFSWLKARHDAEMLTDAEFNHALEKLVLRDAAGTPWMIGADSGRWYRHDGQRWVEADPGQASTTPTPPTAAPKGRRLPRAAIVVGSLVGLAMLVVCAFSFLPGLLSSITLLPGGWSATPVPTALPLAQPTAIASVVPTVPAAAGPAAVLEESFAGNTAGWSEGERTQGRTAIENGEYHIWVNQLKSFMGGGPSQWGTFGDLELQADARLVEGPGDAGYGLMFRYQDAKHYYYFQVGVDGTYALYRYDGADWTTLAGPSESAAINRDKASNRLAVTCIGTAMRIAVNGEPLATVSDSSLTSGYVAVVGSAGDAESAHIAVDNVLVTRLD